MADQVTDLQRRVAGRAFGFSTSEPGLLYSEKSIQTVIYALPLNDKKGHDKRVLLLAPAEDDCRFIIVRPLKSYNQAAEIRQRADEEYLCEFDGIFLPSVNPFILKDWKPDPSKNLTASFLQALVESNASVSLERDVHREEKDKTLTKALITVAGNKAQEIKKVSMDPIALFEFLGPESMQLLSDLESSLTIQMDSELRGIIEGGQDTQ